MTFSEIQKDLEQGKEFTFFGADFISIKMIDGIVYKRYSDLDIAPFESLVADAYFSDHFIGWEEYIEDVGEAIKQEEFQFAKYGLYAPQDSDYCINLFFKDRVGVLHGHEINENRAIRWNKEGVCLTHDLDLTPIKKSWHKNQETQNTINDAVCSLRELLKQADSKAQEELNKMKSFLEALKESK